MTVFRPIRRETRNSFHPPTPPGFQTMEQRVRRPAHPSCAYARARLLLLEPDPDIAALVQEVLADDGYAVDCLARPDALGTALGQWQHTPYDLILSAPFADPLHAPYAWLDPLRTQVEGPLVICARYPAVFYADYRQHGYAAYLEEPFALEDLVAVVARLCAAPRAPTQAGVAPL